MGKISMDDVIAGISLWKWGAAVGFVLAGWLAGWIAGWAAERAGNASKRRVLTEAGKQFKGVLRILGLVFGLRAAISSLTHNSEVLGIATKAFYFLVIVIVTWGLSRFMHVLYENVLVPYAKREDTGIDRQLALILQMVVRALIWVLGLGTALSSAGFDITAVIAGLGVGGLALALAAQDTVANVFGGLLVLTQRPFVIGDRIKVGGVDGHVETVGLRTTQIVNWYGRNVFVPNKTFTNSTIENIDSQSNYFIETRLPLRYDMTPEQVEGAMGIVREVIDEIDVIKKDIWLGMDEIDNGAYVIELWYAVDLWQPSDKKKYRDWYVKQIGAKTQFHLMLMRRFKEEGIKLALPTEVRIQRTATEGAIF